MERRYHPLCHRCGERPWSVDPRAVPVVCDGCGCLLDHFVVRLVRRAAPRAA